MLAVVIERVASHSTMSPIDAVGAVQQHETDGIDLLLYYSKERSPSLPALAVSSPEEKAAAIGHFNRSGRGGTSRTAAAAIR